MLWRLVRGRRARGVAGDILNQASYLVVLSLCLATIVMMGSHITRRLGLVSGDPLSAFARPAQADPATPDPAAPDAATPYPARLGLPVKPPDGPVWSPPPTPRPPLATILPEDFASPPVPTPYDLVKPVRMGTWLPIVMYHYIRTVSRSDPVGYNLSITPEHFRAQLQWLKDRGYTTLTMHEVDEVLAGRRPVPVHPVALTFDDGYRDFYTTAAPLLREQGFNATNYLPTQLVGGKNYMSWREIVELDAEGFEMAAHSQYHVDISKATGDRARLEVFGAKADLESHLGHPVVDWAYPYGGVSVAAAKLVREAGFWSAVTTRSGSWRYPDQMLYLSRARMSGGDAASEIAWAVTSPVDPSPLAPR